MRERFGLIINDHVVMTYIDVFDRSIAPCHAGVLPLASVSRLFDVSEASRHRINMIGFHVYNRPFVIDSVIPESSAAFREISRRPTTECDCTRVEDDNGTPKQGVLALPWRQT
jgi:hypothetical protein